MRHKTKYINKKLLLLKKEENIQKKKKNNFIIILIITLIFLIIFTLIKIFVIKKNTNLDLANEQIINSKVKEI